MGHFTTETASPEGAIALRGTVACRVFRNDFYGTLQNFRGGAVIFLQRDSFCFGAVLDQTIEALVVGAAKAIDGLIRIADDEKLPAFGPVLNQPVLDLVDILKFIHQQMTELGQTANVHARPSKSRSSQIAASHVFKALLIPFP